MPGPGAPLALLAGFAAALALVGAVGAREPAAPGVSATDPGRGADVAVEVRAARPAQTLPGALHGLATETESPGLACGIRTGLAAPAGATELERLLSRFSYLILRIEPSCPPPAVLACRPAVRLIATLRQPATPQLDQELEAVLLASLSAAGFEALHLREQSDGATSTGQVTSRGETVARWRIDDRVLEVATGGLGLEGERPARTPSLRIETNPEAITALFRD